MMLWLVVCGGMAGGMAGSMAGGMAGGMEPENEDWIQ